MGWAQYNEITGIIDSGGSSKPVPKKDMPAGRKQILIPDDTDIARVRINPDTLELEPLPIKEKSEEEQFHDIWTPARIVLALDDPEKLAELKSHAARVKQEYVAMDTELDYFGKPVRAAESVDEVATLLDKPVTK